MNSKNSLTSDPHRPLLNIADKMNLMRSDRYVALKKYNTKKSYKNNKFKIPALTWNEKFEWVIFCPIFKIILNIS